MRKVYIQEPNRPETRRFVGEVEWIGWSQGRIFHLTRAEVAENFGIAPDRVLGMRASGDRLLLVVI
jgi:hypothetical protein